MASIARGACKLARDEDESPNRGAPFIVSFVAIALQRPVCAESWPLGSSWAPEEKAKQFSLARRTMNRCSGGQSEKGSD